MRDLFQSQLDNTLPYTEESAKDAACRFDLAGNEVQQGDKMLLCMVEGTDGVLEVRILFDRSLSALEQDYQYIREVAGLPLFKAKAKVA